MAFALDGVVPWGRRLCEYRGMFDLSDEDIRSKRIMSVGDGRQASTSSRPVWKERSFRSIRYTGSPQASSGSP